MNEDDENAEGHASEPDPKTLESEVAGPQDESHETPVPEIGAEDISELMWDLDTDNKIKNLTWWWWWWLFFIKNPKEPSRPRQIMILWSTKNCDSILVNDYLWERNKEIVKTGEPGKDQNGKYRKRGMTFDGMVGVWYYDGETMHEPFALERSDYTVEWRGPKGYLRPHTDNDYLFSGETERYRVIIRKGDHRFDLTMTPWNDFMSTHRFNSGHYIGKMGYNIYKIYGSLLEGHITSFDVDEDIEGSAYFQKVTVNAPAVPWFWGMFHTENGSYLDYFNPHFGLPAWRKTASSRSFWDRGFFTLSRQLQFYDAVTDRCYEFKKGQVSIMKALGEDELPIFWVKGNNGQQTLAIKIRAYSRAYWRFKQRYMGFLRSTLYYNEYPSELMEFELRGGERDLDLDDLGYVVGNTEHSWGWLA